MARWIIAAGLLGTLMASPSGAAAEWFFRGTANGWAATAMVSTDGVNYDTCQSFQGGDASGGPRFKIDRYGNWQQSYPAADKLVNANTHYQIRINAGTQVITTTAVDSCEQSGFAKTLPQLQVRGTFNGWASLPMTLVGDHLWQAEAYMDGKASQRLKFDQAGDWATNFGDSNADGVLERSGGDIFWGGIGTVHFQVNDQTLAYSITPFGDDNQPPLAVITPGGTVRVAVGDALTLSGSDSTDPDGQIAGYLWSSGETTESIVINTSQAGTFTYGLTVTDDQGAKASSSVSVVVAEPQTGDKWYFRGTPNNWGLTAMTSQDGVTFCTEQAFGSGDPRFKVDHKGDWTEAYPAQDYKVTANTSYRICFDSQRKALDVAPLAGADTQAPTASASPAPGNYAQAQSITLSVSDDKDSAPRLYFTLDGSTPSTGSALYSGQTISASDKGSGADLVIKTLGVDAAGNRREQSFSYYIGEQTVASGDFRAESIYFLLTARFYDGDAGNNYYNRDRYKAGDPQWRGDFKGLIGKLDYIKDLGFTAIWVTPPVENRSGLDYHGYHAYDFYRVDPRLESPGAGYREFIQAAHAKGIKVIQDVVINHSSQYGLRGKTWIDRLPIKYYVPTGSKQGLINNGPYQGNLGDYASANRCDDDNPAAPDWYKARCQSDPEGVVPLVDPKTGSTVPSAGYNPNRFFGIDAQTLDPAWYHLDGFMSGGDWENPQSLQRKHMAGDCIDLATGNQNVKDYINGAIHQYLDMGVDAIRIDTLKHIERDELLTYVHDWQAHKPGLFVFGENLVKGTGWGSEIANDNASAVIRPWWYTRTTSDPANPRAGGDSGLSVLDFSLFSTFRDNVTKGSFGGVGGIFGMDWVYGDATKLITFFQNHDVGPDNDFKYRYGGEEGNAAMTYNLLWTARGIPTLYYGEEVMFQAGKPQDIDGATMTVDQTGRAYYGDVLDNPATPSHPLYQHLKRLNQIRKAVPALQKAPMSQVNEWGSGISFVRDLGAEGSYAAVGLAANSAQQITMSGVRNGSYTDAVTGTTVSVSNGSLSFQVPAYSARIWVLGGPGKVGADGKYLK